MKVPEPRSNTFWNYRPTADEALTIVGLLVALALLIGLVGGYIFAVSRAHSPPDGIPSNAPSLPRRAS